MKTILAGGMLLVSAAFAAPAWAMPFVPVGVAPGLVVQITGGCGRGFHRGAHGACCANPRAHTCPHGYHIGPGGRCRGNGR